MTQPRIQKPKKAARVQLGGSGTLFESLAPQAAGSSLYENMGGSLRDAALPRGGGHARELHQAAISIGAPDSDQEVMSVLDSVGGEDKARTILGLGPDINVKALLTTPEMRQRLSDSVRTRAEEEVKKQAPKRWWQPSGRDIVTAALGPTTVNALGKTMEWVLPAEAETKTTIDESGVIRHTRAGQTRANLRATIETAAEAPFGIGEGSQEELEVLGRMSDATFAPLDIFSETVADVARIPKQLIQGDASEIDVPALRGDFEGAAEAFRDRPLKEQIALGIIDPFLVFGVAKNTARVLPKLAVRTGLKKASLESLEAAERTKLRRETSRTLREVAAFPNPEEISQMVQPRMTLSAGRDPLSWAQRKVARALDPSSLIQTMVEDSPERIAMQAKVDHAKLLDMGEGFTETVMARFNENVDLKSFGVDVKNMKTAPLANNIRPKLPTGKNPRTGEYEKTFFGNVVERPDDYILTAEQRKQIDYIHNVVDDMRRYAISEGIDVKEWGSFDEALHYFPRRVKEARTGKWTIETRPTAPGHARSSAHRILDYMDERVLENGGRYLGPDDAVRSYVGGLYKEIARKRMVEQLRPLTVVKKVPEHLIKANRAVKRISGRMGENLLNVKKMKRGFIPTGSTRGAMKKQFPDLVESIDELFTMTPEKAEKIIAGVNLETFTEARITPQIFRDKLLEVQNRVIDEKILASSEAREGVQAGKDVVPRKTAKFNDESAIHETVRELSLEQAVGNKLLKESMISSEKFAQESYGASIDELAMRMSEHRADYQSNVQAAQRALTEAKRQSKNASFNEMNITGLDNDMFFSKEVGEQIAKVLTDNGSNVWGPVSSFAGVARQLRTIADFGAPLVQGLPLLFRNPEQWGKATTQHILAIADPKIRSRYIADHSLDIEDYLRHGGAIGSTEFTETLTTNGWLAALPTKIADSGIGNAQTRAVLGSVPRVINFTTNRFSNSFETFLDISRVETWRALRPSATTKLDAQNLAKFVNELTGTSSSRAIGVPLSQRQFEAAIPLFAPRYFRAMAALTMDTFAGGLRGDQARKSMAALMMGVMATHVATQQFLEQEVRLDPSKPGEFLRSDIAGQRVGFGGKSLSFVKILAGVTKTGMENPQGFLNWDMMSPDAYLENPWLRAMRNQSSPVGSAVADFLSGADALGKPVPGLSDPVGIANYVTDRTLPFWLGAAVDADSDGRNFWGRLIAGLTEFGGGTTFEIPTYDRLTVAYDKYAQADYGMGWEELKERSSAEHPGSAGKGEQRELLARHPDLRAMQDTYDAERRTRAVRTQQTEILLEREHIKLSWMEAVNQASRNLNAGVGDEQAPQKFREAMRIAASNKRFANQNIEAKYPNIIELTNRYYDQLGEDDPFQALQNEYFDRISSTTSAGGVINEVTAAVDYQAMDAMRTDLSAKYGETAMTKLDNSLRESQLEIRTPDGETHSLDKRAVEYYDSFNVLRPYWEAYKEIVPQNQWAAYDIYQSASDAVRQSMLRTNPGIGSYESQVEVASKQMLRDHTDMDMALVIFYGRTPQNVNNKAMLRELWLKSLN